jgi:hypothetical protein
MSFFSFRSHDYYDAVGATISPIGYPGVSTCRVKNRAGITPMRYGLGVQIPSFD